MNPLEKTLQKLFAFLDRIQFGMSERWREHTNRRTVLILVVVGVFAIYSYLYIIRPPDSFPLNNLVTIPEGASVRDTANILKGADVIRSRWAFHIVVKMMRTETTLHAGDYLFKEPRDVFAVAKAISLGAFGLEPFRIRVHEGATTKEMARLFDAQLQRFDADKFLAEAQPKEGYFFPDTYFFLPNATEQTVINTMRQNFDDHLETQVVGTTTLAQVIEQSGKSLEEIVILASIIEREARNPTDRRLISGVLWNRLKKNMPLQVDVTFIYTLGKGTFQLTMADLKSDSPYNTYVHKGLPPTAIGSPSLDSLIAAAMPTKSSYLFFLADHDGVTHFCKDFACQSANKDLYF